MEAVEVTERNSPNLSLAYASTHQFGGSIAANRAGQSRTTGHSLNANY